MRLQRCFALKSGINGLLDVARRTYCEIVGDIESMVKELGEHHKLPLRVGFNAQRGYHVQMTKPAYKKKFKLSDLPDSFLSPQQYRTTISFTTEHIVKADRLSQNALREISLMSDVIVQELVSELRVMIGSIYKLTESISTLDMLTSFADVSSDFGYVRPSFGEAMMVKNARHPILERLDVASDVVSNDITANIDANFHILTGPNMSGKSTYLKQILLLQIMAQVGCFVPAGGEADGQQLPAFFRVADSIFSRVGTQDSIECNASTFAVEMKETAYILNNMGPKSIIIIDELGRGTSCQEGTALCWAISEKLARTTAFTFLATHYQLLTKMEAITPGVVNHSFVTEMTEAGNESARLVHTHKLALGHHAIASLANYGLQLAKTLRMPQKLVDRAEEMARTLESSEKIMPGVCSEDVQTLNTIRLYKTLVKLANSTVKDMCEKLAACKLMQATFNEDADDEDDEDESDEEESDEN